MRLSPDPRAMHADRLRQTRFTHQVVTYLHIITGNVTGAIQLLRRHQTTTQYNLLTNGSSSQQDKKRLANNNRRVLS